MKQYEQSVFISYAWGGESEEIVNQIDQALQQRGLKTIRDKRELGYKGSINAFMERIGRGHAVIVVISDKYLKSPNCMFELVEIAKNKDIYDRVFPIVLGDADIYNPVNRIKYIKHWEDKLKKLDDAIRSISSVNLQGMLEEINSYDEIRDNISNLTYLLEDMNTLTPDLHRDSDFSEIYASIEQRIAKESVPLEPEKKTTRLSEEVMHSLVAIVRANLDAGDRAFNGKTYEVQAGVSRNKPEGFEGEAFELSVRNLLEPVVFDILFHSKENISLSTPWHQRLEYQFFNPKPQLVVFAFHTTARGPSSFSIDFYHNQRWLKTFQFKFETVEVPHSVETSEV